MNRSRGTLYIIGTPIGNLRDVTLRALDTLRDVALIACEDTRQTAKLLAAQQIRTPMVSLHDHNERQRTPELLARLKAGDSVALVCDGGTPLISDPGWWLVRRALDAEVPVGWVAGPTALIGALVLSGLPTERFVFEGFLPAKPGQRRARLESLKGEPRTVVLYESPHRLLKMLADVEAIFGDIVMSVSRELTKRFEETRREPVSRLRAHFAQQPPRGEFVIVFTPRQGTHAQ